VFRPYADWEAEPTTVNEEDERNPWYWIRKVRQERANRLYARFVDSLSKHGEISWMTKYRRLLWYRAWLHTRDAIRKYRYFQHKLDVARGGITYVKRRPGKRWK